MTTERERDFARARGRDWRFVAWGHLIALPLSILVFAALCRAHPNVPFPLLPHFAYWTIVSGLFVWVWPLSFAGTACMVLAPVTIYRFFTYRRHGGTAASLGAGLRGNWLGQSWFRRAAVAGKWACLPTWWLVRRRSGGAVERQLDEVDPPLRRPSKALWSAVLALAISLNHLPFFYAAQIALCVRAPGTLRLTSWAGPCQVRFGYAPGVRPFGCSERPR
jgi:hypothetical protein